jgi:hypothetical protein
MFQQFIAIIRGSYYLRSYSSNVCVVDVYGLRFVQCGQLWRAAVASYYYLDTFVGYFITVYNDVGLFVCNSF